MQISITTRHFKADEQIRTALSKKLERLERFFSRLVWARVILVKEGYRHIVEIVLSASNMQLVVKEASEDMYSAVDLAVSKLEKQLLRFRDKTKEHKARRYKEKIKRRMANQISRQIRKAA